MNHPLNIKLVLASSSTFRQKVLTDAGIDFQVVEPLCDEKLIVGFSPEMLAQRRAEFKGLDATKRVPFNSFVVGTDQVLGLNQKAYDKASNIDEARQRLVEFSGKVHSLFSAFCVYRIDLTPDPVIRLVHSEVVEVPMKMRALTAHEIEEYLLTEEWKGVVGCYRIEGKGRSLFTDVSSDHSAIIGLPLNQLMKALKDNI